MSSQAGETVQDGIVEQENRLPQQAGWSSLQPSPSGPDSFRPSPKEEDTPAEQADGDLGQ
ncbi:MAG: hypothetical protein AAB408_04560 [Patescibacteria group bacterium]